jgi:hypothetical protein
LGYLELLKPAWASTHARAFHLKKKSNLKNNFFLTFFNVFKFLLNSLKNCELLKNLNNYEKKSQKNSHRLGFEPEPPDWDANTLPMSYLKSLDIGASVDLYILLTPCKNVAKTQK